ncbi:MAG: DUF92 domain-containing protein [Thermoplasmata archaeon]|nr:DUF92 domain-containing protein [Thermoplasmata archaeon]
MLLTLVPAVEGIAATVALAVAAVLSRSLTPVAGGVAALFGSVIVVLGGFAFLALLVLFVVASVLATRYGFEEKKRKNVHEGTEGERGVSNVLAHILLPTGLVVVAGFDPRLLARFPEIVLYTAALAFGAADTFASEFGVLAGNARSILTGRPVPPGTNGGVSAVGEMWALVGALTTGVVAAVLFSLSEVGLPRPGLLIGVAALAGFLGCQFDSVLGETLENRGLLTKGSTNFLAMLSSIVVAAVAVQVAGGGL